VVSSRSGRLPRRSAPQLQHPPTTSRAKAATRKNVQASQIGKTKPQQNRTAAKKTAAPETDSNFSREATWKGAADRTESRNPQKPSSPKPEKQPKTQKATPQKSQLSPKQKSQQKNLNKNKKTINPKTAKLNQKPNRQHPTSFKCGHAA